MDETHVFQSENELKYFQHKLFLKSMGNDFYATSIGRIPGFEIDPKIPIEEILKLFDKLESSLEVIYRQVSGPKNSSYFLKGFDSTVFVMAELRDTRLSCDVISSSLPAGKVVNEMLKTLEPVAFKNKNEPGVWIDVTYWNDEEVCHSKQFIRCPYWNDIRMNYAASSQKKVEALMGLKEPYHHGKIVIWNGLPGTGKTFAIRSIMMHWKDQFQYTVISDPEIFAQNPAYYHAIAGDSEGQYEYGDHGEPTRVKANRKRSVFIMEDSADLIISESRSNHFDKIGKLLNMTDGLIGQGREDVFLITFNEQIQAIDKAFLRPGRCIMQHEFSPFSVSEANEWMAAKSSAYRFAQRHGNEITLAEMYSKLSSEDTGRSDPKEARISII